ncbi:hypothetical protein Droror1_Dr00006012 [Drosera rotundifolia]
MSRCIPFPPPDNVWKVQGEALRQLSQLQRERALTVKRNKKKRKRKEANKEANARQKRRNGEHDNLGGNKKHKKQISEISSGSGSSGISEEQMAPVTSDSISDRERSETSTLEEGEFVPTSEDNDMHQTQLEYRKLVSDRVPASILSVDYLPALDLSWLFKQTSRGGIKEIKESTDCRGVLSVYPPARYLPAAGILALPYVVPF